MLAAGKKRVLFYARPETERRGFELGILALTLVARRMPDVGCLGGRPATIRRLPFPAVIPGVLSFSELGAVYRSCDVALVLSHTNLSLLPLELMACGCAVVSNEGPNTEWLLTDQIASIVKADPRSIGNAIIELLEVDSLRLQKIEAGLAFAQSTDWTKELKAIESALLMNQKIHMNWNRMEVNPSTCVVFGGSGFLGQRLCNRLVSAGFNVRSVSRSGCPRGEIARWWSHVDWIAADLGTDTAAPALEGADIVFHLASSTYPSTSNSDAVFDLESNLVGSVRMLKMAAEYKVRRVIFISSGGTVYGVPQQNPIPETHPTDPICSYGIQKLAIEVSLSVSCVTVP